MKNSLYTAVLFAAVALGLTGTAQAALITGFSLETDYGFSVSGVSYTGDSVSFSFAGFGSNSSQPNLATFELDSTGLEGDTFLGCANISGACVPNAGLNVFTPGFGSSGDTAVINDTVEWSDPTGLTGVADPTAEMVGKGGLLVEISGNQLDVWNYCPSSCSTIGLNFSFIDQGSAAPEPATIALFGMGFAGVVMLRRRAAGRV